MRRKILFLTVCIILISILFNNINVAYAVNQTTNTDIGSINTTKYPKIKEKIEVLKKEHPNWKFKILYTGIDWNEAIANEYTGHGTSPKNLVPDADSYAGEWICNYCGDKVYDSGNWKFKILYTGIDWNEAIANEYTGHGSSPKNLVPDSYAGEWICEYCGNKVYDSGSWKCASAKAIKYMMDSRTALNASDIFQFLELSYDNENGYSKEVLKKMLSGSFLDNDTYIDLIINSSKENNVNPYYVTARIIQEQGKQGSILVKGNGYNGQFKGYYNVFNIGAFGANKEKVILNGLAKAKSYEWTSMESSISGGIKILATNYIARGQNTLYLQKFDVENSDGSMYSHQYMQNIMAAQSEGATLRKLLLDMNALENEYTFIIPVYENMPQNLSEKPSATITSMTDINTTKEGAELVRINANPSIKMRNEPNGSKVVGYLYYNDIATRLEKAESKINGTYWDKILKSNGTVGYVARCTYDSESKYKDYIVSINNEENKSEETNHNTNTNDTSNTNTNNNTNTNSSPESVTNSKGDVNGDGRIDSADAVQILKASVKLAEVKKELADVNNDDRVDSADAILVLKYSVKLIDKF